MVLSSLKNQLRSRTRVTTFKFQSALDLKNRLRSRTRVTNLMIKYALETRLRACIQRAVICIHKLKRKTSIRNRAKSGSGAPGPESALRGTKSTTFAKGIFQPLNLMKFILNPVRGTFGFTPTPDIPITPS